MAAVKREDHAEHLHEPARTVDPHAWQSLDNGIIYAQNIAAGLAQADPANAPDYYARAKAYMGKMKALNIRIKSQRSEEHTSELQSLMRISYAVFCLKKKTKKKKQYNTTK